MAGQTHGRTLADIEILTPKPALPLNFSWAICMSRADAAALAGLRLTPGIEVAEAGADLWLRGQPAGESLVPRLLALPATGRFERLASGQLRRLDQRIPSRQLPDVTWLPLNKWLQIHLPAAARPATKPAPVALRLARSATESEPELLLTGLEAFQNFVRQAPLVRLQRWVFAADDNGQVLVRGRPLPPLPGKQYVLHQGVAVPAGYGWAPAVSSEVLAQRLGASPSALVLWHEDGSIQRIHQDQCVPVTRGGVAATLPAQSH